MAEQKKDKKPKIVEVDFGVVGTSLFSGIISEEFNNDLDGQNGLEVFDKMRKGDGAIGGMLESLTAPLLSAKYFVKEYDKSPEAKKHADFLRYALFERLRGGYTSFLRQSLTYLPFGFSLFEKIHAIEDGFVVWDRFAPRIQTSIYLWAIQGQEWIDGHPPGITQLPPGQTDDILNDEKKANLPTIPWEKLIHFANRQEGNNFAGVSILRQAYKHWFYKDLLYKIQGISAERFGVGIPKASHPKGLTPEAKKNLEEMLQNIRANEQAYLRLENGTEIDLMTIKGDAKASSIAESIQHHDRKIYDSVLAGFLNLTSGEGGSNALSSDHSAFFLRALRGYADYHSDVMNFHSRELLDKNFSNIKGYPTLEIENLGDVDMTKQINAIGVAKEKGMVTWTMEDEMATREILGLPDKTIEELEAEKEAIEEKAREEIKRDPNKPEDAEDDDGKKEEEEIKKKEESKKKVIKAAEKRLTPKKREKEFNRNITDFSGFLDDQYGKYEEILVKGEEKYKKILETIYNAADTERVDGVLVLASTAKNRTLEKKAIAAVKAVTKQLKEKFLNSKLEKQLFEKTKQMALKTFDSNEKMFAEAAFDTGQFNSFIAGYRSNVEGVLFNDPRRIIESIVLSFGSRTSLNLALQSVKTTSFNKNVFRLSTMTHAQSAYNNIIYDQAQKSGYTFFKVVVPTNKLKDVSPSGMTASLLFGIYTAAQLNKKAQEKTDGKNSNAVSGLGLHHNSYEFYYPIDSEELEEEEAIAAQQRKDFAQKNK
jgi:hypothetical protein